MKDAVFYHKKVVFYNKELYLIAEINYSAHE